MLYTVRYTAGAPRNNHIAAKMSEEQLTGIIEDCTVKGISFSLENENLRVTVKKGNLIPEDLMSHIVQQKEGIVRLLRENQQGFTGIAKGHTKNWFDEQLLNEPHLPDAMGYYEVMHTQEREYARFEIFGAFNYNVSLKIKFTFFDREILEEVIKTIVTRHESLRTSFKKANGILRQVIHAYPMEGFSIEYIHLEENAGKEKALAEIVAGLSKQPFNLETGPLINIKVVHYDTDINWLLFTMHHVISDATSLNILRNELEILYGVFTENETSPLKTGIVQYKDYSRWVNKFLSSNNGRISRDYYHQNILASIENEMRSGSAPGKKQSYKKQLLNELTLKLGAKAAGELCEKMCGYVVNIYTNPGFFYVNYFTGTYHAALKKLAVKNKATVFSVFASALAIAFFRIRKRRSLRISVPYSTRVFEPFEEVVGFLVSKVIVFVDVDERSQLTDLIAVVEHNVNESARHRFYPNELLLKELDLTLDVLSPIQVNYIIQKGRLKSFVPRQYPANCHFEFRCAVHDYENGLEVLIDYQSAKYTSAEVDCIYLEMLKLLAANA